MRCESEGGVTAASVGGNVVNASKPVCNAKVSKRGNRKAKEMRSMARVMPNPPLLKGKGDSLKY